MDNPANTYDSVVVVLPPSEQDDAVTEAMVWFYSRKGLIWLQPRKVFVAH